MRNLIEYIDEKFTPDRFLCENEAYQIASTRFNSIISKLEKKHPESKDILFELIIARAVLETAIAKYMFQKSLDNECKVCFQKAEKRK